jgi:hypothetical protein
MNTKTAVWKYAVPQSSRFTLQIPKYSDPLAFVYNPGFDGYFVYFRVDPTQQLREYKFRLTGTGQEIEENDNHSMQHTYIGTAMDKDGFVVYHLFQHL